MKYCARLDLNITYEVKYHLYTYLLNKIMKECKKVKTLKEI